MNTQSNAFLIQTQSLSTDTFITVSPAGQTITTPQGVWGFGPAVQVGNGNVVLLNGAQAAGGFGIKITLQAGDIYHMNLKNNSYKWTGSGWTPGAPV